MPPHDAKTPTRKRAKRVTIEDVALHAGVSRAAVSRVMRNAVGASDETRDRVRAAIEQLGYRPHAGARGMRGRTYAFGVIVSPLTNPWHATLVECIAGPVDAAGYQLLIGAGQEQPASDERMIETMIDHGMDGLILIGPRMSAAAIEHAARRLPTVVFGHDLASANCDTVTIDNALGTALVLDHLAGLGHKRIAHIGPDRRAPSSIVPAVQRADQYAREMAARGLPALELDIEHADTSHGGYEGARLLLGADERPTAIFAGSDAAAMGVMWAAGELGVRIPEDLSLVGWDNTDIARLPNVSLTTVDQEGPALGALLAELLLERVEQGRTGARAVRTAPRLVTRRSTAAPGTRTVG